ncbi:MAG: SRPBCC domain-containing protein [bacterium]|nr:SRPBCC domain-containing protein [bacterium]
MSEPTPVGKTRSQGWETGVRRTFPLRPARAWALLTRQPGLGYWLGTGVEFPLQKGDTFTTVEGTKGEIRSYSQGELIRMRWQPPEWDFESTLQIRVLPAKTGATISFHHELLQNADQREAMRQRWTEVLEKLYALVEKDSQG